MTTANEPTIRPLNVLIVDDDATTCLLLELFLKKNRCKASSAYTLKDARAELKNKNCDVIFLDNQLPDGYGIDFIKEAKALKPGIKIILITGTELLLEAARSEKNLFGADYFLAKPLSNDIIGKVINEIYSPSPF